MKTTPIVLCLLGLAAAAVQAETYTADWASLDRRPTPSWWTEAKFGIFIHWGPYAVPAYAPVPKDGKFNWNCYAEWYQGKLHLKDFKAHHEAQYHNAPYGNFASQFKAENFDADAWADLFKRAGAKYVVLTSKHHDGFALWPSPESPYYNAKAMGPGRDLADEFCKAMRKAGLKRGFYYSMLEYANPLYPAIRDGKSATSLSIEEWNSRVNLPQLKELVQNYEADIVWPDGEWDYPSARHCSEKFLAWLFNESKMKDSVVVNDRWGKDCRGHHGGHYTTEYVNEGGDKSGISAQHPWEECRGIGNSFGYNRFETPDQYMSREKCIDTLVSCVSRGGNLLLNVGPTSDGRIPAIMQDRLLAIGAWLKVNGEAIYATTRGDLTFSERGLYATKKGDVRYVIDTRRSGTPFVVKGVPAAARVSLLGSEAPVVSRAKDEGVEIVPPTLPPAKAPCDHAWVYRIDHSVIGTVHRTLLVHPDEFTDTWIERAASLGIDGLYMHPVGGTNAVSSLNGLLRDFENPAFRARIDRAREKGIEVGYEFHAASWLLPRDLFAAHPEYFRMDKNGRRNPKLNFCFSNAEALDIVARRAVELAGRLYGASHRYFFWLDDVNGGGCACETCRQLSESDQQLIYVNRVVTELRKTIPDATLCYLAYYGAITAPRKIRPVPGVFFEFAPYRRDMKKAVAGQYETQLKHLPPLFQLFGKKDARLLEYWYDNSLFSKYRKPPKRLSLDAGVIHSDFATYRALGFEDIACFACYLGDDYEKLWGAPDVSAFARGFHSSAGGRDETDFTWSVAGGRFRFSFDVVDTTLSAVGDMKNKRDLERGDRVEVFFSPTAAMTNWYYCAEIDPKGRVLDYRAAYHRQFDYAWHFRTLACTSEITSRGYRVAGSVAIEELQSLGIDPCDFHLGSFRADFDQREKLVAWCSLVPPGPGEADFHRPCMLFSAQTLPTPQNLAAHRAPTLTPVLDLPPGKGNPRNSEGTFAELKDGRILFVYSHFHGKSGADEAPCQLAARVSRDNGRTWGEDRTIVRNELEANGNVMSPSLFRLTDGRLALFYLRKETIDGRSITRVRVRMSADEGETWGAATEVAPDAPRAYRVVNNARVLRLSTGRLLIPYALHAPHPKNPKSVENAAALGCFFSDDDGRSWRDSSTFYSFDEKGHRIASQEPGVVELRDGRVLMYYRTNAGRQWYCRSADGGITWGKPEPSSLVSPLSPATIKRIRDGRLVAVWNDHANCPDLARSGGAWSCGVRTPLTLGFSNDEGLTWEKHELESGFDPALVHRYWFCYTDFLELKDGLLLGYCAENGLTHSRIAIYKWPTAK